MTRLPLVLNQCTEFSDPSGAIVRWSFFVSFFFLFIYFIFSFFPNLYSFFLFSFSFPFLLSRGSSYLGHRGSIVSALSLSLSTRQSMSGGETGGGVSRAKAERAVVGDGKRR
jgi:hypothetical protein